MLVVALGTALAGAVITGPEPGVVTGRVDLVSASTGNLLSRLSTVLPLGFAFGAGMVSAANPCGFAMVPAYLGLYLGETGTTERRRNRSALLLRAILVASTVTLGFILLFGMVGIAIGAGARPLVRFFPWIGLGLGVLLALAGTWLLAGGSLYTVLAEKLAARMGNVRRQSIRGYFAFGLAFGTASLSCTLPVFLTVVGTTLTAGTLAYSAGQFTLYGLGMGAVILALTLSIALFQGVLVTVVRRAVPYVQPISSVLLFLAGAYLVYYWLTLGGLLDTFR